MRTRIAATVAIIGVTLAIGWYVFAQTEAPPDLLSPFAPNSVLTSAQLNALIDRVNALTQLAANELNPTPRTIQVDCGAGQTITNALLDADGGDTIQITGTCTEKVSIFQDGLILDGQGSAIIDGGGGVPTVGTPEAVVTVNGAQGVVIQGLTVQNGPDGILVGRGADALLDNVIAQDNAAEGIRIAASSTADMINCSALRNAGGGMAVTRNSSAVFRGTMTSNDNGTQGILVFGSSQAFLEHATVQANNNGDNGVGVFDSSSLRLLDGSTVQTANNTNGLAVRSSSSLFADTASTLTIDSNAADGLQVTGNANADLRGTTSITANGFLGVSSFESSNVRLDGNTLIQSNGNSGAFVAQSSNLHLLGLVNILNNTKDGLFVSEESHTRIDATVVIEGNTGDGIRVLHNSQVVAQGGSLDIQIRNNGRHGVSLAQHSSGYFDAITTMSNNINGHGLQVLDSSHAFMTNGNITGNGTANSSDGVRVDDSSVNISGSTITGNGGTDITAAFGARLTLNGNTIGTIVCDLTFQVLSRGDTLCPATGITGP